MSDKLAVIQGQKTIDELKKIEAEGKKVVAMFKDMVRETDKVNRSFNIGKIREYTTALRDLNRATTQYTNIERQLAEAMQRTARLELQQARLQTENARTRRELAQAAREESRARQQATREAAAEARQERENSSAHAQLTRQTRQARQTARDYGSEMVLLRNRLRDGTINQQQYRQQMAGLARSFRTSTQEAIRLERELRRINQQTLPSGQRFGALRGRVTDILKGLGIAATVDNIASSFYKLGMSFKDTAVKLETLRLAQKSVFKTNEEVSRQNQFLTDISQKYGIELISLSQAYNSFSASAQGTTLEGEKTKIIFDAVSKSSAMLGVNAEDTNGILRALGQMMSKGKVQAEELRGQLGDRMAGAFRLFADGMGISTAQLDAMLKKGEVMAEDVLPKFAQQLNKKYKLGIGEEIETSQAAMTRMTNAWTIFVDNVEQRSSIAGNSISSITAMVTGLLKEITPSSFITEIQKQQVEFNKLGIELRQNFNDTQRRKDLIDQMISINPFFLDGLDKEKVTLEQIGERLMMTNQQYVQKILLQKNLDEINELWEEYGERIRIVAQAYAENSVAINNLTPAQYKIMEALTDGKITIDQAQESIRKLGGNYLEVTDVFNKMNIAVNTNTVTSKGFIGTTKSIIEAVKDNSEKYNGQVKILDKLIKSNGNLLGVNNQLINSNFSLGGSFNYLAQQQELAARKNTENYLKTIATARALKQAYTSFNGFFFDANTGKNTGKKVGEWDIIDNKLVKRKPTTLPEEPKKPKAASLTAAQRDFVMDAQGSRDNDIANLKKRRIDLEIGEKEYWTAYKNIITSYSNKIDKFLGGKNAKERQVEGAARKKAIDALEQSIKEIYDIESKGLEENFKMTSNVLERKSSKIENAEYLSGVERIQQQMQVDGELIVQLNKYYDEQIKLAGASAQSVIEWERKRDEEVGKIEDQRMQRLRSIPEAFASDLENQSAITQFKVDSNAEDQRALILADKKLTADKRAFKLSQLEKDLQIKKNEEEIKRLGLLKAQIYAQVAIRAAKGQGTGLTPEEEKALREYEAASKNYENSNTELKQEKDKEKRDKTKEDWKTVTDSGLQTLKDLGFDNLANSIGGRFDELFKQIVDGSISAKDAALLAASAIADGLSSMITSQKNHTIAALDEQLKYSQEAADQETEFINGRLEQLNALEDLTIEQVTEREKLEDEARGVREQQQQREKMIETQKAKAEQKAASQQALINGALAATMTLAQMGFPAGVIPAAIALGFGIAQSVAIMSKDPTPKYWKGRKGGPAEFAWTQEKGAEVITDENDNIKSLGSNSGAKMTYLEAGDKVYTAEESKSIMRSLGPNARIGHKVLRKAINNSFMAPVVNVAVNNNSKQDEKKMEAALRKAMRDFAPTSIIKKNGVIIEQKPGRVPRAIGTYDLKTGEEKWA